MAEARAWRLALLLTGAADAADRIMLRVLDAQPDLDTVEPVRRDRLVILRAREEAYGATNTPRPGFAERVRAAHLERRGVTPADASDDRRPFEGVANALLQLSMRLPRQQHEALMLHRVEGLELRQTARAMDCSTTAAARHLDEAERVIAESMGRDYASAGQMLRRQAHEAPVGEVVVRMRVVMERRQRVRVAILSAIVVVLLGACAVAAWLLWPAGATP
jgi:RNA polymerase sigma-70 factor (ECF subfamily)